MKKIYFIILIFASLHYVCVSQQEKHDTAINDYVIIKINPPQLFINEISLSLEKSIGKRLSIESTIGVIYDTEVEKWDHQSHPGVFAGSLSHYYTGGTNNRPNVSKGAILKFNMRYYLGKKLYWYFSPMLIYKYLYYNKKSILEEDYGGGSGIFYTQSEKSHVIGLSILFGRNSPRTKGFLIDIFTGIGGRARIGQRIIYEEENTTSGYPLFHLFVPPETENIFCFR